MVYFVPVFMISISYFSGLLITKVLRDNNASLVKTGIIGTFFVLCTLEAFVLTGYSMGLGFKLVVKMFCFFQLLLCSLIGFIFRKDIIKQLIIEKPVSHIAIGCIVGLFLINSLVFILVEPNISGDYTAESVNTLLTTDRMFEYDYLTGMPLTGEVSIKDKLDELPFLYGSIAYIFDVETDELIYHSIPIWGMALCLMVYILWAGVLYDGDENSSIRKIMFVGAVSAICLCGAFSADCLFYYQIFEGFRGESICYGIIVPYCVYELLQLLRNKKWQSFIYILMAVFSAVLITSPAKALIPCTIVISTGCLIALGYRLGRYVKWHQQ